ncbi:hypothetical protein ACM66B_005682 [Microbotryomycetes sp. NB124-2]
MAPSRPTTAPPDDDDDVDFDDPRFLVDVAPREQELTYAERRRKTVGRGRHHHSNNNNNSIKQREQEERERGLSTSLFERQHNATHESPQQHDSAALRMMKQMGFKPGEALGRKRPSAPLDDQVSAQGSAASTDSEVAVSHSTANSSTGLGSASQPRTEPLKFEIRERRTGLGVPQPKKARYLPPELNQSSNDTAAPLPPEQVQAYLESVRSNVDERKAFGYLRSLRRTCEELDRRNGIEDSPMWKDPEELDREQAAAIRRKAFIRDDDDEDNGAASRGGESSETGAIGQGRRSRGGLEYDRGLNNTVVDDPEQETQAETSDIDQEKAEEEREWFAMDVRTRLGLTLKYLRNKYNYCFWCGVAYEDAKDMVDNCPGELEDDH